MVSIAAGVTSLINPARALGHDRKIIRAMPNTPSLVNAGMTSVTPNALVTPEDADVLNIFRCFGEAEVIAESIFTRSLASVVQPRPCVFMFIEAMADAAVQGGMPRAQAYKFAAQAVMGSAKMVLETGKHPGELKIWCARLAEPPLRQCASSKNAASVHQSSKRWLCMEQSEKLSKS